VHVEVAVASEYRYADPIGDEQTLVVAISQSGETTDTLAAVETARAFGGRVSRPHQHAGLAHNP
jgi:glucosamine--fructose-6-phosphate aminotransferase (isomerizing)